MFLATLYNTTANRNKELLAFVALYKATYKNSVIDPNGSLKRYAAKLKMQSKKISELSNQLNLLGLLKMRGSVCQIVSIDKCIKALTPFEKGHHHFRILLNKKKGLILNQSARLKDYKRLIEEEYFRINLVQQADRLYRDNENTHHRVKGSSEGNSLLNQLYVCVSGSFHLANLLGMSASTGNRRLKQWNIEKKIERRIDFASPKELAKKVDRLTYYSTQVRNAAQICIGSAILNFNNLGSSFKEKVVSVVSTPIKEHRFYNSIHF